MKTFRIDQMIIELSDWIINNEWKVGDKREVKNIHYIGKLEHHKIMKMF
jgi:hypothetical protein